jgi:hypothetical protein
VGNTGDFIIRSHQKGFIHAAGIESPGLSASPAIAEYIIDMLKEQGYTACVIEEVYSTEPKDRRIMSAEGDIKAKVIFPEYNMYSPSSDMGKALLNVYGYTYNGKVAHDDAPDSLALFIKRFVMGTRRKNGTITVLRL